MSQKLEIDLDQESVLVDGSWMTKADIASKIQTMLASGDYKISKLSDAIEQLSEGLAGAKSLTLKLSADQLARLETAGAKLGKSGAAFARDLLMQVLGSSASVIVPPPPIAPVVSNVVSAEEAASAVVMTPKSRVTAAVSAPPVMAASAPISAPSVVVGEPQDASAADGDKPKDSNRRWFNRP